MQRLDHLKDGALIGGWELVDLLKPLEQSGSLGAGAVLDRYHPKSSSAETFRARARLAGRWKSAA